MINRKRIRKSIDLRTSDSTTITNTITTQMINLLKTFDIEEISSVEKLETSYNNDYSNTEFFIKAKNKNNQSITLRVVGNQAHETHTSDFFIDVYDSNGKTIKIPYKDNKVEYIYVKTAYMDVSTIDSIMDNILRNTQSKFTTPSPTIPTKQTKAILKRLVSPGPSYSYFKGSDNDMDPFIPQRTTDRSMSKKNTSHKIIEDIQKKITIFLSSNLDAIITSATLNSDLETGIITARNKKNKNIELKASISADGLLSLNSKNKSYEIKLDTNNDDINLGELLDGLEYLNNQAKPATPATEVVIQENTLNNSFTGVLGAIAMTTAAVNSSMISIFNSTNRISSDDMNISSNNDTITPEYSTSVMAVSAIGIAASAALLSYASITAYYIYKKCCVPRGTYNVRTPRINPSAVERQDQESLLPSSENIAAPVNRSLSQPAVEEALIDHISIEV